jgi:hypothetical protein
VEEYRKSGSSGLWRICVQSGKEAFNTKVSNIVLSSCLSIQWGMSLVIGLDDGWTFHHGCMNLETIHVISIHVGTTWPLPNEDHRTSDEHKF